MKCRSCGWEHTDESKSCAACGAPSMAWLAKHDRLRGRVIDAKYAIVDVLHEGADGRLYHGEFIATGEPVTILALHPHVMHRGSAADFTRLFGLASKIRDDGVVRVLDHGEIEDGPFYLVMEPVCLSRPFWTDDDVVPSFERGVDVALQVLAALEVIHAHGLVHSGIDEEAIYVADGDAGDRVKVLPCAFANRLDDIAPPIDMRRMTTYGAPPVRRLDSLVSRPIDARSDLHAVGMLLYVLLTGRPMHNGNNPTAFAMQLIYLDPPDPRVLVPTLPAAVAQIMMRAAAREPSGRFRTASAMSAALRRAVGLDA